MGENKTKGNDFYQVLGLNKECAEAEVKNAYKKLALKWHPDRCSASGNSKYLEESKKKFQAIQEAYSVLSNVDKRFLYDVGVYDIDDDESGMADFMSEMAVMMSQNKPIENGDTFEELKDLFEEMFQSDIESFDSTSQTGSSSSLSSSYSETSSLSSTSSNKRGSSAMSNTKTEDPLCYDAHFRGFSLGYLLHNVFLCVDCIYGVRRQAEGTRKEEQQQEEGKTCLMSRIGYTCMRIIVVTVFVVFSAVLSCGLAAVPLSYQNQQVAMNAFSL